MSLFANILDFEIIKVFKGMMRQKIRAWFEAGLYTFTAQGNYREPPYKTVCEWVKDCIDILNLPENQVKWAKGFHQCGYSFYDKGLDMTLLGSPHRSLLNEPILKGYAVLPSVEFAHNHNAQFLRLADDEYMIGKDYESGDERQDIPKGLIEEVVVGKLDVSQEITRPDSQGTVVNPQDK